VQNKVLFPRDKTPVFLPKRPKKGLVLLSVRFVWATKAELGIAGV